MGLVSMKVLRTLYQSLGGNSVTRYHVYYYLVSLANKSTVYTDMASTRNMFKQYQYSISWCSEVFEKPQKFVLSDGIQNSF